MPEQPPAYRPPGWTPHKPYANSRTARKRLSGRKLQTRNARIKLRDGYTCKGCWRVTTLGEVDHIVPLAKGGSDADDNLQWLCIEGEGGGCHGRKSRLDRQG